MKFDDLPKRWKTKLEDHIRQEFGENRDKLATGDFQQNLKITFADGSYSFFYFAFYILDQQANEVAVFTEHCGYHIFPLYDTKLEIFVSKWSVEG